MLPPALRMFNMDVGGIITGSPKMMAQSCDVILTILPSIAEVREVSFETLVPPAPRT